MNWKVQRFYNYHVTDVETTYQRQFMVRMFD